MDQKMNKARNEEGSLTWPLEVHYESRIGGWGHRICTINKQTNKKPTTLDQMATLKTTGCNSSHVDGQTETHTTPTELVFLKQDNSKRLATESTHR